MVKGSVRLIESNMAVNGNMDEVVKTEVGEDTLWGIRMNSHLLCY